VGAGGKQSEAKRQRAKQGAPHEGGGGEDAEGFTEATREAVEQSGYFRVSGMCVACVWHVCGLCEASVWHVCGMCVACVWHVCGMCVACVWQVCGMCVACVRHVCDMCVACVRHVCDNMRFVNVEISHASLYCHVLCHPTPPFLPLHLP
jgi:hypothetical protein